MTRRIFDSDEIGPRDAHRLLIGLVVPRPIGWIGTVDREGIRNLAPFSFFNVVASEPPTVMFSPSAREDLRKDSLSNVQETREFTVNIVSVELASQMNVTSGRYPADVDEFEVAGLTPEPGVRVAAPLVAEAPAALECVVSQFVRIGEPPTGSMVVIGEVVAFHVREDLLDGTRVDQAALDALGRMGGPLYSRTRDLFEMQRPD